MKLGEILVNQGFISEDMLEQALEEQKKDGSRLGSTLVKMGLLKEQDLLNALSKHFGVKAVDLKKTDIKDAVLDLIPSDLASKYLVVPVSRFGRELTVAMINPGDLQAIEDIKFATGFEVNPVVAFEDAILRIIEKHYHVQKLLSDVMYEIELAEAGEAKVQVVEEEQREQEDLSEVVDDKDSGPALKLASKIITDAVGLRVSDVHIEPYEDDMRVRYRIDGILHEVMKPPKRMNRALATVIKVMAKLRIEEKRLPQDGRIKARVHNKIIDIRVSTVPTLFGEKVALRILDRSAIQLNLDLLGFEQETLETFRRAIKTPYGIVLVTGPTGSGKTTTLYSALTELNDPGLNIITAEDPIEYSLMGINQLQVHERIGLTFASALRAYLRQDPNIIMVGEIRDLETAEIAIRASLTGHLVLSTVHTNSAAATVTRLINMNVEPFLVASTLLAVQSQRLVRKICNQCQQEVTYSDEVLRDAGLEPKKFDFPLYRGEGCEDCRGTGYKGRVGIFENMLITPKIRELILKREQASEIEKSSVEDGMITLHESALCKLRDGLTTVEEVIRETKVG
ncbi:type II secretion system protein GspE [candidate division TA06 bacterium DG_78]|uniref:Type II secretion system protein GspE n=1 Tax=candidate division TA06 bacterium DG_78 TaxID=1703772 RepID=A0A0S7YCU5_UNCT6|nr:MAG: type II secretion system protein GspE [candidate division TA06 bacterium DG_78]